MAHKVFIFVPAFGHQISASTFFASHAIQQAFAARGIGGGVSTLSFPDIAELRNMALTIFYDRMDASHLLFIDADMGFSADLVLDMLMFDEPVVGALYPARQLPTTWVGSGDGQAQAEVRGGFMKVEGVGCGVMLIRRDAIKIMLEKMPEIVDPRLNMHPAQKIMTDAGVNRFIRAFDKMDIPERGILSEDLSFCVRWGRCGGEVWASIGHKISHVGPFDFANKYADMMDRVEITVERKAPNQGETAPLSQSNGTPVVEDVQGLPEGPADAQLQAAE